MRFWKIGNSASNSRFCGWVLSLALTAFVPLPCQATEITDASRTQVFLHDKPRRVVTLSPALGELTADLLQSDQERIVGVSEFTDYPPTLKKVTSIGPYNQVNLEKIISLKPDLILATSDGNSKDQIIHLRELGLPVVVVATGNFEEIAESMRLSGTSLGLRERGEQMAIQFLRGIARIQTRSNAGNRVKPRVLLQVGGDPLVVAGGNSFLSHALAAVGAQNVYQDATAHYPRPSLEDVLHRNPDMIIVLALGENRKLYETMARKWGEFPNLAAVKSRKVRVLQSDPLLRPSLRLLEGLSSLGAVIEKK